MANRKELSLEVDRYAPAERLIRLWLLLSEARGGLTLDEMAQSLEVTRRTAERLRNKLDHITRGGLLVTTDDHNRKRWSLPSETLSAFATPTMEEIAELKITIARLREQGSENEADVLGKLALKLEAVLPRGTFRRYEPDIEALLESNGTLVRPGPRVSVNPAIVGVLRQAIVECRRVQLTYRRRGTGELSWPIVAPYGFLSGSRGYIVGLKPRPEGQDFRLYALTNVEAVQLLEEPFVRDPNFDLRQFAARSFGLFWDGEQFDVEWRFKPHAANDARSFQFHPDQSITEQPDGSVVVKFKASGLNEMSWHLFTWGNSVEIVKPNVLRDRYREWLGEAQKSFDTTLRYAALSEEDLAP